MGNNINDLKNIVGNNLPLKTSSINKIKNEADSFELKKDENQLDKKIKGLIEKNSPSEILGRSQIKNKKNNKSLSDNFENDMSFVTQNYKTVCLANNMFNKFMDNGYSYNDATLLTYQFVKEIS